VIRDRRSDRGRAFSRRRGCRTLFVIAKHKPKSKAFGKDLLRLPERLYADHKVATVKWMGYALFAERIQFLDEFVAEAVPEAAPH
jgi:hypothetical protein